MTDFLDRLASRILGEAPLVQPLIASRFAPGAEIFVPDTPIADDSHAVPYPTSHEESPATIPSISPPATVSLSIEERHPPDPQRSERERPRIDQAPKREQELVDEADIRKKPLQEQQRGSAAAVPLAAFGTDHDPAPQAHPHDRETETLPASATEPTREQPVGVDPSHSREYAHLQITPVVRETGKTLPANAIHEIGQLSDSIRPERRSTQDPSNVELRRSGPDQTAIPSGEGPLRPVTRPPSLRAPDLRDVDGWTSDVVDAKQNERIVERQRRPSQEVTLSPTEVEIPRGAAQVRNASRGARVVQPERISALQHADSTPRVPAAEQAPAIQAVPTIKVTIGRIEVRAVSPPQSPPQETALPAPKLSLDDYLKSLKGRR
jgi:hypothetical protein